jgi:hypothetical protein
MLDVAILKVTSSLKLAVTLPSLREGPGMGLSLAWLLHLSLYENALAQMVALRFHADRVAFRFPRRYS